jgi:hypothetical protein
MPVLPTYKILLHTNLSILLRQVIIIEAAETASNPIQQRKSSYCKSAELKSPKRRILSFESSTKADLQNLRQNRIPNITRPLVKDMVGSESTSDTKIDLSLPHSVPPSTTARTSTRTIQPLARLTLQSQILRRTIDGRPHSLRTVINQRRSVIAHHIYHTAFPTSQLAESWQGNKSTKQNA